MNLRRYGERAFLCEVAEHSDVPGVRAAAERLDGVAEAVAGARTVLVLAEPGQSSALLRAALEQLVPIEVSTAGPPEVTLDVRYDGPDLDEVASLTVMSADDVVRLHSGATYAVRFCGFAPGFAYLDGLDPRLHVPRRAEPRTAVPAGSVAIAGGFAAVYPRSSPGGWRLLGRTDAPLWDPDRDPPALLTPGAQVRFRPT